MICCEDGEEEYVPYGRNVIKRHPCYEGKGRFKEWWTVVERNGLEEEIYIHNRTAIWSVGQFTPSKFETSEFVDCGGCGDPLAKSSKPPDDVFRQLRCSLTVDTPIRQALFTTFYTYPDMPAMLGDHVPDHPTGAPIYSLCLFEQEYLTVYTEYGNEYTITLPFVVEKAWSMWYGLMLQRRLNHSEPDPPNPLLFSLLHPLDEISPINQKTGANNAVLPCYGTDVQQTVVMTSDYPSITITHSEKHNSVSVWRTRRCNMEEYAAMVHNCSFAEGAAANLHGGIASTSVVGAPTNVSLPQNFQNQSFITNPPLNFNSPAVLKDFTPSHSMNRSVNSLNFTPSGTPQYRNMPVGNANFTTGAVGHHHNHQHSYYPLPQLCLTPSHYTTAPPTTLNFTPLQNNNSAVLNNSYMGCNNSMSFLASPITPAASTHQMGAFRGRSPIVTNVKTPVNARLRSVIAGAEKLTPKQHSSLALFGLTPSPGGPHSKTNPSSSPVHTPLSSFSRLPSHSLISEPPAEVDPIIPDICMELLWTDQTSTKPVKAFFSEDYVSQRFLCLVFDDCIRLIKYEHTNDLGSLVFGNCTTIMARDAAPLAALRMILIVDENSNLNLYSGLMLVSKVHVTPTSQAVNATLFKDFSCLNISCRTMNPSTPMSVRRSSLIVSNRPASALEPKFDVLFSPVVSAKDTPEKTFCPNEYIPFSADIVGIRRLHHPTWHRVTIEHDTGVMHRVTIPDMWSSSLVSRVLAAFKYVLPRDSAMKFMAKWYSTRNSPGCEDFSSNGEWFLFSRTLLTLIGYDTDKLQAACPTESPRSPSTVVTKKVKTTDNGTDKDWDYLLSCQYHRDANCDLGDSLLLSWLGSIGDSDTDSSDCCLSTSALLFHHLPAIFYSLHLLYEELKCCMLYWEMCELLVPCLSQMAADLRADLYLHHYWKDFPTVCSLYGPSKHLRDDQLSLLLKPAYFSEKPPNFQQTIIQVMKCENIEPFPYIPEVCPLIRSILLIYCVAAYDFPLDCVPIAQFLQRITPSGHKAVESVRTISVSAGECSVARIQEKIVLLTDALGLNNMDVQLIAPGLSMLFMNSQHLCRIDPPLDWLGHTYQLINRPDMLKHTQDAYRFNEELVKYCKDPYLPPPQFDGFKVVHNSSSNYFIDGEIDYDRDGMDKLDWNLLRMRWPFDKRIKDVRHMLDSATPARIDIPTTPGIEISEHDLQEEQNRMLFSLSLRTMALPIGRGMFTMSTREPLITETVKIPPLTLSGKSAQRGNTIDITSMEVPPNMNVWPLFHNGVAAALRIQPGSKGLDTSWILYNRPRAENEGITEHGGFLLGLGLTGHLRNLSTIGIHEYLSSTNELTTVGLLLGLAVARRGTCHAPTTKLLSIHLECLLPPTCTELDIHHSVQVASILGIGLLYEGSGHRHIAEVLLREIGRPPGPEMENSTDRESYSLAAGLGLGLVLLGKGADPDQFADLDVAGQLYYFIEGGYQKPLTGPTRDKYKSPSYQIKEGKRVNIDVTAPGATLALGLIYFGSSNKAVAQWMEAPDTPYLLDQVRPDFLLMRTISLGLIMWDEVLPTVSWVEKNIPQSITRHASIYMDQGVEEQNIDYETIYQAYFNLVAGSCMVLGLKFAGSANEAAYEVVHEYLTMLNRFAHHANISVVAGRSVIESCMCICVLSLALIVAGTGDLEVLQMVRFLRERVGPHYASVGYGSHVALHMALGFLFLGGGRFTLSSDRKSVAALLIACFPKMPHHSGDNRYHLQAFRHLYVLACEPRLLMPVDVESGALCRAKVSMKFSPIVAGAESVTFEDMAPLVLPELSKLEEVIIEPNPHMDRYWPVRFIRGTNMWGVLDALLKSGAGVALKLRDGEAPYPALVHCDPDSQDGFMFTPADKLATKSQQQQLPLSWITQSAQLMGIGGAKACRLVKTLVGVDISAKQDCLESKLLLNAATGGPASAPSTPQRTMYSSCVGAATTKAPTDNENASDRSKRSASSEVQDCSSSASSSSKVSSEVCVAVDPIVLHQLLTSVVYDSLALGKPEGIASWLTVIQGIKKVSTVHHNTGLIVWQIKLLHGVSNFLTMLAIRDLKKQRLASANTDDRPQSPVAMDTTPSTGSQPELDSSSIPRQLISTDQSLSLRSRLINIVDSWSKDVSPQLRQYLTSSSSSPSSQPQYSPKTAITLLLLDVPHPSLLPKDVTGRLKLAKQLHDRGVSPAVIQAVVSPARTSR